MLCRIGRLASQVAGATIWHIDAAEPPCRIAPPSSQDAGLVRAGGAPVVALRLEVKAPLLAVILR